MAYEILFYAFLCYEAKTICEYLGGHLVTITSFDENISVKNTTGNAATWIGATDKECEEVWKWVTGEPFSFNSWGVGQPDNAAGLNEGAENYAHIWEDNINWNDNEGSVNYAFLCEFDHVVGILTLPSGLTEIGSEAFAGVAAERVVVPDSCGSIASGAFSDCPNLREISVPSTCVIAEDAIPSDVIIIKR